jgi:cysteine-rich repeat protein
VCGDSFVQMSIGEECDLGGGNSNTGVCTLGCQAAACGDGFIQVGVEQCDDGANNGAGKACKATCELNVCGDGDKGPGEACDDGNQSNDDGCTNVCKLASCGDGFKQMGEECDLGVNNNNTGSCTLACKSAACGDTFMQPANNEECDDGNMSNTDTCVGLCKLAKCGDTFTQMGVEQCDDGNMVNTDTCTNTCKSPTCGDTFVQPSNNEQCDDGNMSEHGHVHEHVQEPGVRGRVRAGVEQRAVRRRERGEHGRVRGHVQERGVRGRVRAHGRGAVRRRQPGQQRRVQLVVQVEVMKCGNGVIDPGERCDTALPAPFVGVTCKPVTCQYNFSQATQLYCNGSCTWAGAAGLRPAGREHPVQAEDGQPEQRGAGLDGTTAQPTFGFPCTPLGYGTRSGTIPEYGVNVPVSWQGPASWATTGRGRSSSTRTARTRDRVMRWRRVAVREAARRVRSTLGPFVTTAVYQMVSGTGLWLIRPI